MNPTGKDGHVTNPTDLPWEKRLVLADDEIEQALVGRRGSAVVGSPGLTSLLVAARMAKTVDMGRSAARSNVPRQPAVESSIYRTGGGRRSISDGPSTDAGDAPSAKRRGPGEMTNTSESGAVPDDPPTPIEPPTPKRGAFPTPKSEIEKAKPYIPDIGEVDDCSERTPDPPTDVDGEQEG